MDLTSLFEFINFIWYLICLVIPTDLPSLFRRLPHIIVFIPVIVYSWKKYRYFLLHKKRVSFALRFLFMCFTGYLVAVIWYLLFKKSGLLYPYFGAYTDILYALCTFILEILWVFLLAHYEIPPEYRSDFMDFDYYLYTPTFSEKTPKIRSLPEALHEMRPEAIIDLKDLAGKDLFITSSGEIIVSDAVLEIFRKHGITGYHTGAVKDPSGNRSEDHYSILEDHIMPPRSARSTIRPDSAWTRIRVSGYLFYDQSAFSGCSDFNKSYEETGDLTYGRQHYWILSKNVVRIFIEELGQPKRDFRPVCFMDITGNRQR